VFDDATRPASIVDLATRLSPGFTAGRGAAAAGSGLRDLVARATVDATFRGQLAGRAWELLKTEGVGGFLRRLRP
jgi:hypothetical protein